MAGLPKASPLGSVSRPVPAVPDEAPVVSFEAVEASVFADPSLTQRHLLPGRQRSTESLQAFRAARAAAREAEVAAAEPFDPGALAAGLDEEAREQMRTALNEADWAGYEQAAEEPDLSDFELELDLSDDGYGGEAA